MLGMTPSGYGRQPGRDDVGSVPGGFAALAMAAHSYGVMPETFAGSVVIH